MPLGTRAQTARGGVFVGQLGLLAMMIAAAMFTEELGGAAWLFIAIGGASVLALGWWKAPEADSEEFDDAFQVAEDAIKREAKRLDQRRADIEQVLMAYGEWMEFPDFHELHAVNWATPERSAQDAEVAKLLDLEADRMLERISTGDYWENGQLQTRTLLLELGQFVETIAGIYNPGSEKPILETNLEELFKSLNRVSLQVILLLEEVPLLDVKEWNLRQVTDNLRRASEVAKKYEDLQPVLNPVRYLWHGSKFLLAANPLLAAGWIAGTELLWKGGKLIGKRTLDGYLLSLVRQILGIVAWETASIYDRTSRFRDPEWIYGVELAHLASEFPLTREGLQATLQELGRLSLRSAYDRIFLYRCVAQHVSPKPEAFEQADLLAEETSQQIQERLEEFFEKHVKDAKERRVNAWRKGVVKRLGEVAVTEEA